MSVIEAPEAILDRGLERERREIVELLTQAYWMEIETVMNYLAGSISHNGARGLKVKAALVESIEEEVQHAQRLGRRIQELHSVVPRAGGLTIDHEYLRPPGRQPDVAMMIEAVVAAKLTAIRHYSRIKRATGQIDRATHAIATEILADEQRHLRLFERYMREYRPEADSSPEPCLAELD
jgi:bacterioferritin